MKTYTQPTTTIMTMSASMMNTVGPSGDYQEHARVPERIRGLKYL